VLALALNGYVFECISHFLQEWDIVHVLCLGVLRRVDDLVLVIYNFCAAFLSLKAIEVISLRGGVSAFEIIVLLLLEQHEQVVGVAELKAHCNRGLLLQVCTVGCSICQVYTMICDYLL